MLSNHHLETLFNPNSIAVVGASDRIGSVGLKVMSNLMSSGFSGHLFPVNPKHATVCGKKCYASVCDIPDAIDLAVITTPAASVLTIMEECGRKKIHSVIIISAGFSELGDKGKILEQQILLTAQQHDIRFIGPNCLGVMRPQSHLNATFDNNNALPGQIALLSQSGAICAAILDWALGKGIGFSTIVSMGNSVDLDFGELLQYLAADPQTKSILLYIEGVHHPKAFIEGLRAAALVKPVIALKAGRHSAGVRAVHSHTGALVGDDDVFSAALRRGGTIRVMSIEQLFTAAEILSSGYRVEGDGLTIITNGGGAGVMAADQATDLGIRLTPPGEETLEILNQILPVGWSHQNPLDIIGDATPERYRQVINTCLQHEASDALLIMLVPVAMSQPYAVAEEVCAFVKQSKKVMLTCWMGDKQSQTSRQLFSDHHIPCYSTPEVAVEAFSYLTHYYQNQQLLLKVPEPLLSQGKKCQDGMAQKVIDLALAEKRTILTSVESKTILSAFNVPVSPTFEAKTAEEAIAAATSIGYPVVMKINSPDITHKQDVGGVQLNIQDDQAVRTAFNSIITSAKTCQPDAHIKGVTVERMYGDPHDRELMIGVLQDKVFGPVISFGAGGSLVEVMQDRAVNLPPLNTYLVQEMIKETRAFKMLGEFRGKPPVNMDALIQTMMCISDLVVSLQHIDAMDINPLLVNEKGVVAVDARFILS